MRYVKPTTCIKKYKIKKICFKNFEANKDDEFLQQTRLFIQNIARINNTLVEENGVKELDMPISQSTSDICIRKFVYPQDKSFIKLFQYKYFSERNNRYDYCIIMIDNNYKVYHANMFMAHTNLLAHDLLQFSEEPEIFKFRVNGIDDVLCFCTPTEGIVVWDCDSVPYKVENIPEFKAICLHNSRLFVIDKKNDALIRYSSNKNPLNWNYNAEDGAGKIELNEFRGMIEKLVSFLDNLYVFTKFGISKISVFTSSSGYSISNIFYSSAKIYKNTICVCGQNILFMSQDGLYIFDGYDVKKANEDLSFLLSQYDQSNSKTCYYNGKFYIACKLQYLDDFVDDRCVVNNSLVAFDIEKNDFSVIRNIDVKDLMPINELLLSKLVLCLNGQHSNKLWQICNIEDSEFEFLKRYEIANLTLGDFAKTKIFKAINLFCKYDCDITVQTENKTKTFKIKGKNDLQFVRVNIKGKMFSIIFKSNNKFLLKPPQFVFSETD
ncbi:MAG: hypothetical protein IJD48_02915 [Clostridia bacterium]|nr:hypothetical protein [Clostridia bacterium]